MSEAILHGYFRSSASYRLRLALNYKKIPYTLKPVNLLKNEQKTEEYAVKNPSRLVPTLEIDGLVLNQSLAILEYLEETKQNTPRILPETAASRSVCRALAQIIACDTQPVQNLRVLQAVGDVGGDKKAWAVDWITKGMTSFETVLQKSSVCTPDSGFCVQESFSMADICLLPQIYNAQRFGIIIEQFPCIHKVVEHCNKLDFCKQSAPEEQPDVPDELFSFFYSEQLMLSSSYGDYRSYSVDDPTKIPIR